MANEIIRDEDTLEVLNNIPSDFDSDTDESLFDETQATIQVNDSINRIKNRSTQ